MVTSRAVVGSSHRISDGSQDSAIAIITRCRMPPENSCGNERYRRSGSGMPTRRISSTRPLGGLRPVHAEVHLGPLGDLLADAHDRVERAHRLLEDHRDLRPADACSAGSR